VALINALFLFADN